MVTVVTVKYADGIAGTTRRCVARCALLAAPWRKMHHDGADFPAAVGSEAGAGRHLEEDSCRVLVATPDCPIPPIVLDPPLAA